MCLCVRERGREKEREIKKYRKKHSWYLEIILTKLNIYAVYLCEFMSGCLCSVHVLGVVTHSVHKVHNNK